MATLGDKKPRKQIKRPPSGAASTPKATEQTRAKSNKQRRTPGVPVTVFMQPIDHLD